MTGFITGRQLVGKLGLADFEILSLIQKGLRPVDRFGRDTVSKALAKEIGVQIRKLDQDIEAIQEGETKIDFPTQELDIISNIRGKLWQLRSALWQGVWEAIEYPGGTDLPEKMLNLLLDAFYDPHDIQALGFLNEPLDGRERQELGALRQESLKIDEALKAMAYAMEICFEKEKQDHKITKDELFDELASKGIHLPNAMHEKIRKTIRDTFPRRFLKEKGAPKKVREMSIDPTSD